jgi:hypothetical protein
MTKGVEEEKALKVEEKEALKVESHSGPARTPLTL